MENNEVMAGISNALGMAPLIIDDEQPIDVESTEIVVSEQGVSKEDAEAEEDFYIARKNFHDILEMSNETIKGIIRIANASEQPRAFEVASKMIKDLTEANAALLKLHEQRRQLLPPPPPEANTAAPNITNNNVFVGTTNELLELIDKKKKADQLKKQDTNADN